MRAASCFAKDPEIQIDKTLIAQHDDVLNVRHIPGLGGEIIETLAPHADDVVAEGRTRFLPNSIWFQVTVDGETGWASSSFLGYLGMTDDATAEILGLAGDTPVAETLTDLALTVADLVASDEPPSRIRITAAPTIGDLGEITVDLVGQGDHPQQGPTDMVGVPVALSEPPGNIRRVAPELGEHTEEILTEVLGWDWDKVGELREKKVI